MNKEYTDSNFADEYKMDLHYISLKPKFKWFRPPLDIKIFKWRISFSWAYKIDRDIVLKGCFPISISSDFEYKKKEYESPYIKKSL